MFSLAIQNALLSIAVPPHWCYVLPRSTEAGGAIIDRHGPSGLGHITWEDLSPSTAVYSTVSESWRKILLLLRYKLKYCTLIYFGFLENYTIIIITITT